MLSQPSEHLHVTNVMKDALVIEVERNSRGTNFRFKVDRSLRPQEEFSDVERDTLEIVDRLHAALTSRFAESAAPPAAKPKRAPTAEPEPEPEVVTIAVADPERASIRLREIAKEFDCE